MAKTEVVSLIWFHFHDPENLRSVLGECFCKCISNNNCYINKALQKYQKLYYVLMVCDSIQCNFDSGVLIFLVFPVYLITEFFELKTFSLPLLMIISVYKHLALELITNTGSYGVRILGYHVTLAV